MPEVRRILAIRFARLGDVVLLLPALARLKAAFLDARLTLMTGHRCAPLAALCPAIDEVISVDRVTMRDGPVIKAILEMAKLGFRVWDHGFDWVIDFHSFRETNLLAWLSRAPHRLGMKRYGRAYLPFCFNIRPVPEDKSLHVAEMFHRVVQAVPGCSAGGESFQPLLTVPEAVQKWVVEIAPDRPRVALYVGAAVPDRMWPVERFAAVGDFVIEQFGASVLLLAANSEAAVCEKVRHATRNKGRVVVLTQLTMARLVGAIGSAQLLVSNDTGPMHIGPAMGVPTLGLFSVGFPEHYGPLGANSVYLRENPIEGIQVEDVQHAMERMWLTAAPGHRR